MKQSKKGLLNLIKQSKNLSAAEKKTISKAAEETETQLEETVTGLKTRERDLKIEASLERVRAVALRMKKPSDMLEVCKMISTQLELLGVKQIRNVQTAIFYEARGTYMNYEYYARHKKTFITEVSYKKNKTHSAFAAQMLKGKGKYYYSHLNGKKLKAWIAYQKTTNVFVDKYLEKTSSLNYYFHSLGPVSLGISTYSPLSEDEVNLFKRLLKVFELSYRRYLDIEKAEAQACEARIEASLEKVRAVAMSMNKPGELLNICETLFKEFKAFGFDDLRNAMINIHNDDKKTFVNYDYSDAIGKSTNQLLYDIHPVIEKQVKQMRSANDAFSETVFAGKDLVAWKKFRKKIGEKDDPRINKARALYYYFYSLETGSIGISTFSPVDEEKLKLLKRFRNVFNLSYQRYIEIALAEAQAKEAKLEASLEKVRAQAMSIRKSDELAGVGEIIFKELKILGFSDIRNTEIIINKEAKKSITSYYYSDYGVTGTIDLDYTTNAIVKKWMEDLQKTSDSFAGVHISEKEMKEWRKYRESLGYLPDPKLNKVKTVEYYSYSIGLGALSVSSFQPITDKQLKALERFKNVFGLAYRRYADVAKAETQAREAQIEASLERVRGKAMAMHKSDDLNSAVAIVFEELDKLNLGILRCGIGILNKEKRSADVFMRAASEKGKNVQVTGDESMDIHPLLQSAFNAWLKQKDASYTLEGDDLVNYYKIIGTTNIRIPESQLKELAKKGLKHFYYVATFQAGGLFTFRESEFSEEGKSILRRFASVFNQTYKRFLDIQKSEAQARESQIQLALERVRARTMAMQKSDELPETTFLLFQQLKDLGETAAQLSIGIIKEEDHIVELSAVVHGNQMVKTYGVPADDPYIMKKAVTAWKEKQGRIIIEIKGKKLKEYNNWRNNILKKKINFSEDRWIVNIVFFSKGMMSFSSDKSISEEAFQLLERFAKVFEQTYTRFLDLQKAEAQGREAQIELALERIRARTMAMHKSEEFMEVINLVSEQLQLLNIVTHIAGFSLDYKAHPFNIWMAAPGQPYPSNIDVPYREIPMMQRIKAAIDSDLDLYADTFSFEEKNQWLDNVLENTIIKYASEERKKFMLGAVGLSITIVMQRQIALMMGNYSAIPYTDMENAILKRFSMVFEQTYIRYLDLQKAEAQAKEAQIEAALEKVRSRSLSVHKSDEFKNVISVVFEKMQELEIPVESAGINIYVEGSKDTDVYACGHTENGLDIRKIRLRYFDHPIANDLYNAHKNGLDFFVGSYGIKDKNSYYEYQFEHGDLKELPVEIKERVLRTELYSLSMAPTKNSIIIINNFDGKALSEIEISIQKRFAKVFEQAYTRFLDLQKAEAQSREAQIELGLERVRARAMAMQKSDELAELVDTVFKELTKLDFALTWCMINIIDENSLSNVVWTINSEAGKFPESFHMKFEDYPFHHAMMKQWKERNAKSVYVLEGQEKKIYDEYLFNETEFRSVPAAAQAASRAMEKYVVTFSFSNFGGLQTVGDAPLSESNLDILSRFGKVFDLTYTRFNDLKKAEAQAREAKIEASLERVRGKAMAMHQSSDLSEAAEALFTELNKLGINPIRTGFVLLTKDSRRAKLYPATSFDSKNTISFNGEFEFVGHPVFEKQYESWRKGENYFPVLEGDVMKSYYGILSRELSVPQAYFPNTQKQYGSFLPFNEGFLFTWSDEPYSEKEINILERFKSILDLTIRRFLDLQKAEAQAKEAQIETALERVRSRSMGMQKSEELKEVIQIVYEQFAHLNIHVEHTGFIMDYKTRDDMHIWLADKHEVPSEITIPYFDSPHWNSFIKAKEKGEDFFANYLTFEEKNKFYRDLFKLFPVPDETKEYYFNCPGLAGSTVLLDNVGLYIENFSGIPYTNEENNTLMRFGKVFQQTHTRFLDLQKSEAQAREAQIEAGLERVRSRTLAMHKSDELAETAAVVFRQLINLGIEPNRLYIAIIKDDSGEIEFWITDEDGSKVSTQFSGNKNGNKTFEKMYSAWNEQKKSITIDMQGQELQDYFHYLSEVLKVPFKQGLSQKRRVQTIGYFAQGFIGIASPDSQPDETTQLLERFASVFNLTYTRFNDLQIAEAQTHKAQIEVALERVRARALAMQQPEELVEVAEVLRHEMGLLGVEELETSTIFIHDENSYKAECWFAIKDTIQTEKKLVADHITLDLNETWVGRGMLKFYSTDENQISIPMIGVNRREWIEYCYKLSNVLSGFYGENIPDRIYHLYKFSNGAIGAASPGDISDESWELLSRAASVFSLAYSRFKDLTQARTDLTRLKEEKKRSEEALTELKATQSQLIQSEKMASLGELTAGIAHEIQNPLNFVNNFSEVNTELIVEMKEEITKGNFDDVKAIANDISDNEQKINHHGKRAEAIVKGMLQHSRSSSGQKEPTNINTLADEYLRLAYHGLRAKDKSFNALMKTDYDESIGSINIIPQDIGRVILNLITNAFYVVNEKKNASTNSAGQPYEPTVSVSTKKINDKVFISVKDNGNGIPQKVLDKIFQPFFTTKPTGQGTGLGLSLSYDIIKTHGGEIKVETKESEGTEFIIQLLINE
jgi:signal transduction histidine kinase